MVSRVEAVQEVLDHVENLFIASPNETFKKDAVVRVLECTKTDIDIVSKLVAIERKDDRNRLIFNIVSCFAGMVAGGFVLLTVQELLQYVRP